jgi:phospholipid/cholesterol/gamma-HCH transport system ATP-binding protein
LVLDPKLVFLDEPASGLDPIMAADLDELVLTLRDTMGLSVVIVTHDLDSIFHIADTCILLDKEAKTIIARGDPKELKDSSDERVRAFFQPRTREKVD